MKDSVLTTVVVFGLMGFLLPIYNRLGQMAAWEQFSPADAQALTLAMLSGVAAIGAALGINIRDLLKSVTGLFNGKGSA